MPRTRKNEKGILEVGFFIVKKQAHYPTSPCSPQAAGTAPLPPDTIPLPTKPKGIRKGAEDRSSEDRKCLGNQSTCEQASQAQEGQV